MVVVELNSVLDRFELRDEGTEKAGLQHLIERVKGIGCIQNREKAARGSPRCPKGVIHQVPEFADQPFGFQGKGASGF